ncbi:pentapeptide repeat-containing protein [Pseudomonas viridiflava]|uniref:anti-phage Hailong system effector protein HalA n=1 Tax=Pseudomonas viridiflava TaxID=33069 RepID=UPI000F027510|nr:pentapeptide repeat-containing protein [Pseudomonas viridiflava]QXG25326.1 pentapeptide repeat-containing protein [Pseudomonas viridiflava]
MSKRRYAWWDCLYTLEPIELKPGNWDFTNNLGPTKFTFNDIALTDHQKHSKHTNGITFRNISFDTCDFLGNFEHGRITFKDCKFSKCDLGNKTVWQRTKFNNCTFSKCSFTLTEFNDCTFYECSWDNTTVNGSTRLINTVMSDACEFINSGYTNLDQAILDAEDTTREHQLWRLDKSKVKLSRMLMQGGEHHGDDQAYYTAVKSYLTQVIKSNQSRAKHNLVNDPKKRFSKLISRLSSFELMILMLSGWVNNWGQSIAKPAIIGALITLAFGVGYSWEQSSVPLGMIKAFDITFLIGYTKHSILESCMPKQLLYATNAFIGLWWYAIMVPCLVNRISRVM